MMINVQVPEAAELIWELFKMLPKEKQPLFAAKCDSIASLLEHPNLDGAVVLTVSGNGTL